MSDDDVDSPLFSDALLTLIDEPAKREAMRAAAASLGQAQAAAALADVVEASAR